MKTAAVITQRVSFRTKRRAKAEARAEPRTQRVVHALALAHHIDKKIRCGELRDYAHAAKVLGVTRARVSQITGLLLLAPDIQAAVLDLPETRRDSITERQLREIVAEPLWAKQMRLWGLIRRHR
jgi:hypothetical protein